MLIFSICVAALSCILMIAGILFFPKIKLGRISIDSYWVFPLLGALLLLLVSGRADAVFRAFTANTAVNPLKLLVLFLSMTALSVFLDELGFFRFLACAVLSRSGRGQKRLFFTLYAAVSVLTVFTSNDIIVLSFTPFILYFAAHAKVDPIPYLAAEFVAANTWSMALVIGNPTNIYLAAAEGIDFVSYLRVCILPTLAAGMVALFALYLLFRKRLKSPIEGEAESVHIEDRLSLVVGILHLALCTLFLAVGNYFGIEMWLVALTAALSLCVCSLVISLIEKKRPHALAMTLRRLPYPLVPFMLSMFAIIVLLEDVGATGLLAGVLGASFPILKYGILSFFTANLINNIPMSVLFAALLEGAGAPLSAVYATVIGSNLGALFTPIGALAGMMWTSLLKKQGVTFGYLDFLKLGAAVALPALAAALGVLALVV